MISANIYTIDMNKSELGVFIKTRLKTLKRTQGELAEHVDVSNVAVTKWIKSGKISRENAVKTAEFLGVSVDQMLGSSSLSVENELERQLLMFFRGMRYEHRDDVLTVANNLYSIDNPKDRAANPSQKNTKAADKTTN